MVIHSASDPRPRTTLCGDYFYNYFSRGLDILFDGQVLSSFIHCESFYGEVLHSNFLVEKKTHNNPLILQTHKIKKFVLHTNFPGHADFNSYIKCNFSIYSADCKYLSVTERFCTHASHAIANLETDTFPSNFLLQLLGRFIAK